MYSILNEPLRFLGLFFIINIGAANTVLGNKITGINVLKKKILLSWDNEVKS